MGRKIPGRKHRGVKDPEKQREERFQSIKHKVNAPPQNADEQHVPKSLERLIQLKNRAKVGYKKIKRKPKIKEENNNINSKRKPEKAIPVFQQFQGENDRHFLYRVNRICNEIKKEAAFEEKYNVDIKRNTETGEVEEVVKRPKDELELFVKKLNKEKANKKKKKNSEEEPKLTKSQKRQVKLKAKKQKLLFNKEDMHELPQDHVQFGDVVHAPPTLTAPRKVVKSQNASRPGKKELLLKSLMKGDGNDIKPKEPVKTTKKAQIKGTLDKKIDKKGKRKGLPNALRRQLDKQQKDIVQAYKDLKAKKYIKSYKNAQ